MTIGAGMPIRTSDIHRSTVLSEGLCLSSFSHEFLLIYGISFSLPVFSYALCILPCISRKFWEFPGWPDFRQGISHSALRCVSYTLNGKIHNNYKLNPINTFELWNRCKTSRTSVRYSRNLILTSGLPRAVAQTSWLFLSIARLIK